MTPHTLKKSHILIGLIFVIILIGVIYIYLKPSFKEKQNLIWLNNLITKEESGPVANPPASVTKCMYKNQIVYYLPSRCCDISSVLYNENGEVICAPDGGFTGRGDGKCPDFFEERKNCEIIWKDSRSYP